MNEAKNLLNRRAFLNKSARLLAGSTAVGGTALSYARIAGANDRISLGHIGNGSRGSDLDEIVARLHKDDNAEMTAVCDLWKVNREAAEPRTPSTTGVPPAPSPRQKNCWNRRTSTQCLFPRLTILTRRC